MLLFVKIVKSLHTHTHTHTVFGPLVIIDFLHLIKRICNK